MNDDENRSPDSAKKRGRPKITDGSNADKKIGPNGRYYKTTYNYNEQYSAEMTDSIRLRVPKGWRDIIKDYVNFGSYGKYRSTNDLICTLLAAEIDDLTYPVPDQSERLEKFREQRTLDGAEE